MHNTIAVSAFTLITRLLESSRTTILPSASSLPIALLEWSKLLKRILPSASLAHTSSREATSDGRDSNTPGPFCLAWRSAVKFSLAVDQHLDSELPRHFCIEPISLEVVEPFIPIRRRTQIQAPV